MSGSEGSARLYLASGVPLLHPEEQVFTAMLDGWRHQQLARNLGFGTVEARERLVRRFYGFAEASPWAWTATDVDEFFTDARAVKNLSHTTLLGYQNALRLFMAYLTDPHYGWPAECEQRFGTHPVQICHEWNTARHVQEAQGRPGKRALTHDELQAVLDHADDRAVAAQSSGRKGWISAFRDAVLLKTAYAWGLRRNEVRNLELCDLATNPKAREFGAYGIIRVRYGKAMRGSPPKRRSVLTVPLFDWAVEALQQWTEEIQPAIAGANNSCLWPSERGDKLAAATVTTAFTRCRKELDLPERLDFHSLRRSYVSHLIEAGYDALFVQQQVGHEHASTTALYTHVSPDYRARTVRAALDRITTPIKESS
ncbi:tyrosine-type recombinase/integrase [Streptomyces sp. BA2]|uniref:tyrosine-type recombinase/integrase n=1 Tax=Streptomyces sp. BA2 TaxID=436595 RepID=UPI0013280DAA|nr:tyrosine-type recombinase/integrase [Streptomyces sp. BA2]MWA09137.1 tyrosine-type recombinase/integrase [Streptomyces sp. BA2]